MSTTDPQFLYMILILPSVFGLTFTAEQQALLFYEYD